jgi:UDP-N-acetylmuramoylalanine--D-glutamate ligase
MRHNSKLKVIVGLGKTGYSCVRHLVKHNCNVAVVDSRKQPPMLQRLQTSFPNVLVHVGNFLEDILAQADELIVSPGVSINEPSIARLIKKGIPAIGDIELFARCAKAPIIAITGSNGKSTVTTLVGEMARCAGLNVQVGGNLGTPALDLLNEPNPSLYVLELSSFQLETTYSLNAEVAVVLNISPDHLDRYKNMDEYIAAKMRIYNGCQIAIINRTEQACLFPTGIQKFLSFGSNEPGQNEFGIRDNYLAYGMQNLLAVNELKIRGQHQAVNALAALAIGTAIRLPMSVMLEVLRKFEGLPHRCQWVAKINGVDWYNDSKGTNVGAAQAAIEGMGTNIAGKLVLIAGGRGKGADFSSLYSSVKKYVRSVILIGEDAPKLATALNGAAEILNAKSMRQAVKISIEKARQGDIVLLSPACASFDMFDNFEHRGKVFAEEVNRLKE